MKILAVDFDGVISDSALKSLFVSHNAYCKYFGSEVKKNFGGKLFTFNNWEEIKKQYKKEMDDYRRLRSYIELSGDFFVIIKIMEEQIQIKDQQEFIAYRNQLQFDYQFFRELSFEEKEEWQKKSFRKGKPFIVSFNRNILVLRWILKIFLIKTLVSIKQSICRPSLKNMVPN